MSWTQAINSFALIHSPRKDHTGWRKSSKAQAENLILANQIKSAEQETKTQQENNREAIVQWAKQLADEPKEFTVEQHMKQHKGSFLVASWFQRLKNKKRILEWAQNLDDPTIQIKRILTSKEREIMVEDLDYLSRRATPNEIIQIIGSLTKEEKQIALLKLFFSRKASSYLGNLVKTLESLGYMDPALTDPDDSNRFFGLTEEELAACCGDPQHK